MCRHLPQISRVRSASRGPREDADEVAVLGPRAAVACLRPGQELRRGGVFLAEESTLQVSAVHLDLLALEPDHRRRARLGLGPLLQGLDLLVPPGAQRRHGDGHHQPRAAEHGKLRHPAWPCTRPVRSAISCRTAGPACRCRSRASHRRTPCAGRAAGPPPRAP